MMGTESVFDVVNGLSQDATTTIRIVYGLIAVAIVSMVAAKSRGAIGAIVMAGIAMGVGYYFVHNMTDVGQVGEDTLNGIAAVSVVGRD